MCPPDSPRKGSLVNVEDGPRTRTPTVRSPEEWHPSFLMEAEDAGDEVVFERLITRHIHPLQRYLLRHAERTGSALPRFSAYLRKLSEKDPGFKFP